MKTTSSRLMISLLFIGYVFVYIDKTIIGFALLPLEEAFSLTATQLGAITGVFFLAYSCFQIPAGWLNDRIGYRRVLLASLTILGLCAILFGWLGASLALLVLFRFLAGIGHAGYPCTCAKAVTENIPPHQRTFAQSVLLSSSGLAMTIGPLLAVWALAEVGWRGAFIVLGFSVLLVALFILFCLPAQSTAAAVAKRPRINWGELLRTPLLPILFICLFGINICTYGLLAWLPKFLVQSRDLSVWASGVIVAAGGLGIWVSSMGTGWLVGRYLEGREPQVILIACLLSAAGIIALWFASEPLLMGLALFVADVFMMAAFVTAFTLPMKRLPEAVMGTAIGILNTGGTLGGFISPIVMGALLSQTGSYYAVFLFLTAAMAIAGLGLLPLLRNSPLPQRS